MGKYLKLKENISFNLKLFLPFDILIQFQKLFATIEIALKDCRALEGKLNFVQYEKERNFFNKISVSF